MTRRGAGEGSIFKDPKNGRWRALVDVGADASGKRQRKKVSGRTRAEVLLKMREVQRDAEDGLASGGRHLTVAALAEEWLRHRSLCPGQPGEGARRAHPGAPARRAPGVGSPQRRGPRADAGRPPSRGAVAEASAPVIRVGGTAQLGPTKTAASRRQLRLPAGTEDALRQHRARQLAQRDLMGAHWQDLGLVFPTSRGTLLDPANLRRSLRTVTEQAGLGRWHPHELRHSAASLLSAAGVALEEVADVLGHASTRVTSATYRHRTTPTVEAGARPMQALFGAGVEVGLVPTVAAQDAASKPLPS